MSFICHQNSSCQSARARANITSRDGGCAARSISYTRRYAYNGKQQRHYAYNLHQWSSTLLYATGKAHGKGDELVTRKQTLSTPIVNPTIPPPLVERTLSEDHASTNPAEMNDAIQMGDGQVR